MAEPESAESQTIRKCMITLEQTLRRDMKDFAIFFLQHDFIKRSLYNEVLNPRLLTEDQKVEQLLSCITNEVELDSEKYHEFVTQLRNNLKRYGKIVGLLDETFYSFGGKAAMGSEVDQNQPPAEQPRPLQTGNHQQPPPRVPSPSHQQGYPAPQQGYAGPQQGHPSPQQGYASPQQGYYTYGHQPPQPYYHPHYPGHYPSQPPQGNGQQLPLGQQPPGTPSYAFQQGNLHQPRAYGYPPQQYNNQQGQDLAQPSQAHGQPPANYPQQHPPSQAANLSVVIDISNMSRRDITVELLPLDCGHWESSPTCSSIPAYQTEQFVANGCDSSGNVIGTQGMKLSVLGSGGTTVVGFSFTNTNPPQPSLTWNGFITEIASVETTYTVQRTTLRGSVRLTQIRN